MRLGTTSACGAGSSPWRRWRGSQSASSARGGEMSRSLERAEEGTGRQSSWTRERQREAAGMEIDIEQDEEEER
jgi:hypothetical protein